VCRGGARGTPEVKIVEGRMFTPGTNEIVVGRGASRQFEGLTVGASVKWGQNNWQVVGIFEAHGNARIRDLVRRQGAPARLSARQHLPVGLRAPAERGRLPGLQGRPHGESPAVGHAIPRARAISRPSPSAATRSSRRSAS
jgi:hypothetical protein